MFFTEDPNISVTGEGICRQGLLHCTEIDQTDTIPTYLRLDADMGFFGLKIPRSTDGPVLTCAPMSALWFKKSAQKSIAPASFFFGNSLSTVPHPACGTEDAKAMRRMRYR
jgi:hypothetical protein